MQNEVNLPFIAALRSLRDAKTAVSEKDRPEKLPPKSILTMRGIFQPRVHETSGGDDERHVKELARALRAKPRGSQFLDPILVVHLDDNWVCIDGHHRLAAYHDVGLTEPIPVEIFAGDTISALSESIRRNTKDCLFMTQQDKMEAAWRLVLVKAGSKRLISDTAGVSERSVANMRSAMKQLIEEGKRPLQLQWTEAKRYLTDQEAIERDEDWEDAQARDWAKRLGRTFGKKFVSQPRAAALALEFYSTKLPLQLIEEWTELTVENLRERGYTIEEPEADF